MRLMDKSINSTVLLMVTHFTNHEIILFTEDNDVQSVLNYKLIKRRIDFLYGKNDKITGKK